MKGRLATIAGGLLCAVGCNDTSAPESENGGTTPPTAAEVAGDYRATTFTTEQGGTTTNQLAAGALLEINLLVPNTTTGRLFVPGGEEDGSDLDASMEGTWALSADTVTFSQTADTFVRDVPFVYATGRLTGQRTFSGVLVRVILTKQ